MWSDFRPVQVTCEAGLDFLGGSGRGLCGRLTADKGLPELMEAFDTILQSGAGSAPVTGGLVRCAEDALCAELRSRIGSHPAFIAPGLWPIRRPTTAP